MYALYQDGATLVGAKTVTKWVFAAGLIGVAGALSGKYLTTEIAIVVLCGTIVFTLLLAALITRFLDPPMDRWIARHACDWLDGRRVRWWIRQHPAVEGEIRRLYASD